MNSYQRFALYYDMLTRNIDYNAHADYYDKIILQNGGKKGILLDLACGTGSLSEAMARKGYDVIGVDLSDEMLSQALDKKFESKLNIQYLKQDMCRLDMYGTVDVTICALDSLNHLPDINHIKRCIDRVSLFSNPDALFIFDVNTIYKHKEILSNNTFVYDTEEVYCIWQNTYSSSDNSVDIDLVFFEKEMDVYKRYEENFKEISLEADSYVKMCEEAGMQVIGIYDYLSFDKPRDNSEKITFVARKVR